MRITKLLTALVALSITTTVVHADVGLDGKVRKYWPSHMNTVGTVGSYLLEPFRYELRFDQADDADYPLKQVKPTREVVYLKSLLLEIVPDVNALYVDNTMRTIRVSPRLHTGERLVDVNYTVLPGRPGMASALAPMSPISESPIPVEQPLLRIRDVADHLALLQGLTLREYPGDEMILDRFYDTSIEIESLDDLHTVSPAIAKVLVDESTLTLRIIGKPVEQHIADRTEGTRLRDLIAPVLLADNCTLIEYPGDQDLLDSFIKADSIASLEELVDLTDEISGVYLDTANREVRLLSGG